MTSTRINGSASSENCIENIEALVKKVGKKHKKEILNIATGMYFLAIADCREYWHAYTGGVNKTGLKEVYDKIQPRHNYNFWA